MWKVFLVEDEKVIREGFRDNIPWEQYGFKLVGDASDGEMALPMIRKSRPDVLITDIKMPFMDGLALSKIVRAELPHTKIIIISGYDDFEYARQAIQIGVDQYLLKPVTRLALRNVLVELREKFAKENEQRDYQTQYAEEAHEYEQFSLRRFFEGVLDGSLSVEKIYEKAAELSLDLNASCYNLMLISLTESEEMQRDYFVRKQDEVFHYFLRNPHFIVFRMNVRTYGVLLKGEREQIDELVYGALNHISRVLDDSQAKIGWYVAISSPVERISALPNCFKEANHYFAYRFILPGKNILSAETLAERLTPAPEIRNGDLMQMDPEIIKEFLNNGEENEIHDFVESYLQGIKSSLRSTMFRAYVIMNIRFAVVAYLGVIDVPAEEYQQDLEKIVRDVKDEKTDVFVYFVQMLQTAMGVRDQLNDRQGSRILNRALKYINENYSNEELSLSMVAEHVDVSANYLSSMISQNLKCTFVEYVTEKRIEQAKKLLRRTDKPSGEIAREVGYKDPHYFSFVFKKMQGMSPREYRANA